MFSFRRHRNENDEKTERKEKEPIVLEPLEIIALEVNSFMDIKNTVELLEAGKTIVISFKRIRDEDSEKAKEFLRRILEFVKAVKGNLLAIGNDYLMISPHWVIIKKLGDPSHQGK